MWALLVAINCTDDGMLSMVMGDGSGEHIGRTSLQEGLENVRWYLKYRQSEPTGSDRRLHQNEPRTRVYIAAYVRSIINILR